MIFLLRDQETSYCIYNTYILRSESFIGSSTILVLIGFGVRAFYTGVGNWIIGAQQNGFPFFYFQRFDISHGDTYRLGLPRMVLLVKAHGRRRVQEEKKERKKNDI